MGIAKVIVNGVTTMDVTQTTATADKILQGYGCIGADGEWIDGTATGGGSTPSLQSKSATPTTSQQTVTADSGYDGLSQVTVNPIPSQYIIPTGTKSITENGTGIDVAQYASVDVAVESGPDLPTFSTSDFETFTCDKTYAECLALFNNKQHGAILSYQADTSSGTVEVREFLVGYSIIEEQGGPLRYCAVSNGVPVMQINYNVSGTITKSSPDSVGTLSVSANGTYDGELWNTVEVNVPSSAPTLQSKTATPTESQQTVSPDSGYDGLSSVTVGAISSTYVGSGITQRSSTDLTASGATVTAPAGYYSEQASKSVALMTLPSQANMSSHYGTKKASVPRHSGTVYLNIPYGYNSADAYYELVGTPNGTAGTPTATKGTVSNHSVSVTPSVTNTTGYIEGGTKNGTAVTVSASELVSGSETKTENGTYDVTNLASLVVNVAGGGSAYRRIEVCPQQTATPNSSRQATLSNVVGSLSDGLHYVVTYDGSEYYTTCELLWGTDSVIGEPAILFNTVSDVTYPFAIDWTNSSTLVLVANDTQQHTVKVERIELIEEPVEFVVYHTSSSEPTSSQGSDGDIWLVTA